GPHSPNGPNGPHSPHGPHSPNGPNGPHSPHGPHGPHGPHSPYGPHNRTPGSDIPIDISEELRARLADFTTRTGVTTALTPTETPAPRLPHTVARHLLTILGEALENTHRHAHATHVTVGFGITADSVLRLSVQDDGGGLPPHTSLEELRKAGHFGLVGMVERAAAIGARIRIGRGDTRSGTEVRLDLPLAALTPPAESPRPHVPHTPTPLT
ncbi:sensor histidine kinase, partial [Streptomyces sp. KLOTTS4A1]|uniref:sensor histidine kinase n=1 Tax=Streptomyces sp. KLOTTS4A1 TaxID=3390996 RepID=UPI0039F57D14